MKEYIERESLQDEIRSLSMSITGLRCGKGVLNEYLNEYIKQYREGILRIVDGQPTADVISVVRCKDCKHLNPMEIGGYRKCLRDNLWKDTDDFCSRGERRKEDAEIH